MDFKNNIADIKAGSFCFSVVMLHLDSAGGPPGSFGFFLHVFTLLSLFIPGENCNRGAALGALLGAGGSYREAFIPQEWKDELRDAQEILPDVLKQMQ